MRRKNEKRTSFEHEVSKERRATLKDLFKVENLDPIPVEAEANDDDDASEPRIGLFSITSKSITLKIHQTRIRTEIKNKRLKVKLMHTHHHP